jgi:hypothetical protein
MTLFEQAAAAAAAGRRGQTALASPDPTHGEPDEETSHSNAFDSVDSPYPAPTPPRPKSSSSSPARQQQMQKAVSGAAAAAAAMAAGSPCTLALDGIDDRYGWTEFREESLTLGASAVASFLAAVLTEISLCNVCSCQEISSSGHSWLA